MADIERIEELGRARRPRAAPLPPARGAATARCAPRCSAPGAPLALSDLLPLFENMGVEVADERPYAIAPRDREGVWIYDFGLTYAGADELETDASRDAFQDAFVRDLARRDRERRLQPAGAARRADLARGRPCCARSASYLRQAGTTFSDHYVEQALVAHPRDRARCWWTCSRARFDPAGADAGAAPSSSARRRSKQEIDAVENLDQDRILRSFLA